MLSEPKLSISVAQMISGFVSFGCLHITTTSLEPWQWLMIITGIVTLITAVAFWYALNYS
jgi:ACS family allantoate permease-like MFS transporter